MCLSSRELWKFLVFIFWNFRILNFLHVILGVFNFFIWSFARGEIGYLLFFWKLWRSFVLVFWSCDNFNFFLVILRVFNFVFVKISPALFTHHMVLHQTVLHDFSCFVRRILFNLLCMFSYLRSNWTQHLLFVKRNTNQ